MSMKEKRLGMLMGGNNAEHDVSLATGRALAAALRSRGYCIVDILVDQDLPLRLREEKIEVAFVALHGRWGEDGCVQGLLEAMRVPYTGSGVLASALAMDKAFAKMIFRHHGLKVLADTLVTQADLNNCQISDLPFSLPVVIKPTREGSSVGVSIVRDAQAFKQALSDAAAFEGDVLVERYAEGREIQVAVLDGKALGAIEVKPAAEFYDYKAKYDHGGTTQYIFPARLNKADTTRVCDLCLAAYKSLGCCGISRIDTIFDPKGEFFLLEVNTIPGMTKESLVPKIAAGLGISFEELAEKLLLSARLKA